MLCAWFNESKNMLRQLWLGLIIAVLHLSLATAQGARVEVALTASPGDTLSEIARRYGVSVSYIAEQNSLNAAAGLVVGQRLVIAFNRAGAGATPTPAIKAAADPAFVPLDPKPGSHPNPYADSAQVCFMIYADSNQNGAPDPGEHQLPGGVIDLRDAAGDVVARLHSNETAECLHDLPIGVMHAQATSPDSFALTSSSTLRLELGAGRRLDVNFGVAQGAATAAPLPFTDAPPDSPEPAPAASSPLRDLSGLFLLTSAILVFAVGGIASLITSRRVSRSAA